MECAFVPFAHCGRSLVPTSACESPPFFARGLNQGLVVQGLPPSVLLGVIAEFTCRGESTVCVAGSGGLPGVCMAEATLVSVVEDDQFFRESMKRLMRSLGYAVEVFPSAADFLASPRLVETACLIAAVRSPGRPVAESTGPSPIRASRFQRSS